MNDAVYHQLAQAWATLHNLSLDMESGPIKQQMQKRAKEIREYLDGDLRYQEIIAYHPEKFNKPSGFIKPDTPARVFFYEQEFYVLSNFSAFTLQWKGRKFDTSEAAYHFEKFPDSPDIQELIIGALSAHEAYQIASRHKVHRRVDWDDVKVSIMLEVLRQKVVQHEYVRRKLMETGFRQLIEDSWRDSFWGWGEDCKGLNMLGKLWEKVREELRAGKLNWKA
jgi:ribA/ribD-fused uncharacterized protein